MEVKLSPRDSRERSRIGSSNREPDLVDYHYEPVGRAGASTNTNATQAKKSNAELAAQWAEARLAYPIYAALASQFKLAPAPYPASEVPPARPTRSAFDRDLKWLDEIDGGVLAYQLRQIPSEILNGSEPSLRAFIQRHVKKPDRTVVHRDKLDWLLAQYFALCAPEELYREEIGIDDVATCSTAGHFQSDAKQ